MARKKLKGFVKTRHFKERQNEREVTDRQVIEAILRGNLTDNEQGQNFLLGTLKVTVNLTENTLITVHPGEARAPTRRLLTPQEARSLKAAILARTQSTPEETAEDEFQRYVQEFKVKKIT